MTEDWLQELLDSRCEPTGETREVEEVRYRDGAGWFRAEAPAHAWGICTPIVERRTIRQRQLRQVFADGQSVLWWETYEGDRP